MCKVHFYIPLNLGLFSAGPGPLSWARNTAGLLPHILAVNSPEGMKLLLGISKVYRVLAMHPLFSSHDLFPLVAGGGVGELVKEPPGWLHVTFHWGNLPWADYTNTMMRTH